MRRNDRFVTQEYDPMCEKKKKLSELGWRLLKWTKYFKWSIWLFSSISKSNGKILKIQIDHFK